MSNADRRGIDLRQGACKRAPSLCHSRRLVIEEPSKVPPDRLLIKWVIDIFNSWPVWPMGAGDLRKLDRAWKMSISRRVSCILGPVLLHCSCIVNSDNDHVVYLFFFFTALFLVRYFQEILFSLSLFLSPNIRRTQNARINNVRTMEG